MKRKALAECLDEIHVCEALESYGQRNKLVLVAMTLALDLGMNAGVRIDPKEQEWPVVFIDLPTGQVSWHIKQYGNEWDGHSTDEKYKRCDEYSRLVNMQ